MGLIMGSHVSIRPHCKAHYCATIQSAMRLIIVDLPFLIRKRRCRRASARDVAHVSTVSLMGTKGVMLHMAQLTMLILMRPKAPVILRLMVMVYFPFLGLLGRP